MLVGMEQFGNSAGSTGNTSGGATYGVGDILSIAVDLMITIDFINE